MKPDLTKTQQQIVDLLCQGYTNQEIITELTCTPKSLDNWLKKIKNKTGLTTRKQIINFYKI